MPEVPRSLGGGGDGGDRPQEGARRVGATPRAAEAPEEGARAAPGKAGGKTPASKLRERALPRDGPGGTAGSGHGGLPGLRFR